MISADKLKENVIRAEGYAEGFRAGYLNCAQAVANELAKEQLPVNPEIKKEGE